MCEATVFPLLFFIHIIITRTKWAYIVLKKSLRFFYPALTGSKSRTLKLDWNKEVRRRSTARKRPIGSTNN
ncbi:hypothetical protein CO726_11535 [Bacillus fungorum]|uniref:Uncharacterized protein n=1 Tax=Bacillus fungorum TaxID=2039284 RepID=A0A2G6QEP3_9BACI|nr:hypothetical protein CO726_11535 [Bacillus fungorum]